MLLIAVTGNFFVACSSDDEDDEFSTSSIVGTWKYYFSSGYILLNLEKNGSGYTQEFDWEDGGLGERDMLSYYYDDEKKCYMVIEIEDGEEDGRFPVLNFNDKTLTVRDDEGDLMTFTRVTEEESRVNSLLVGKWRDVDSDPEVDLEPTDYDVALYENGLGVNVDESFVWMYNHTTKILTISDDYGNLEYLVKKITSDTLILYDYEEEEEIVFTKIK